MPSFLLYKGGEYLTFQEASLDSFKSTSCVFLYRLRRCCRRLSLFQYLDRIVILHQDDSFVHPVVPLKSVSITLKQNLSHFS